MYEYIILGLGVLLILFAIYMGLFSKLTITERAFPGGYYVYYDYQGHINSAQLFHKTLQRSLEGVDCSRLTPMTITYDDPFNLVDPRTFRASLGFLLPTYDADLLAKFKKLHYTWKSLPSAGALYGEFPYRNAASLSFGSTRFLPTCLTHLMRNQRRYRQVLQGEAPKSGTIEVIENGVIKYYLIIEKQKEFVLTTMKQPELKNEDKFTSIYYKKKTE